MNRRTFFRVAPGLFLTGFAVRAGSAELAVAHLRIDGMT
jgi:hypothetical protein